MKLEEIIEKINQLRNSKTNVVVAIDGGSGSGKSSLAEGISKQMENSQIVHLDEFDLYQGTTAIDRVITEIFESNRNELLIVEGIFALDKKLLPYYDLKIWVDCPREVGLERGLKRDLALNGIDNSERWLNYWLPKEDEYIKNQNPSEVADIIVDGTN